jgi:hypothetical protein
MNQILLQETSFILQNNKLNAVIVVLAIILLVLGIFLWRIDKRVKNLEDKI